MTEFDDLTAPPPPSYYDLLGVSPEVSEDELLTEVPERLCGTPLAPLQRLQAAFAWEALADARWRRGYDEARRVGDAGPRELPQLRLRPLDPARSVLEAAPPVTPLTLELPTVIAPESSAPVAGSPAVSGAEPSSETLAARVRAGLTRLRDVPLLRAMLPRLLTIYVSLAIVLVLRYAHEMFVLAPSFLDRPGLPGLLAALALGTGVWLVLELPILARSSWRLRAALWGGGLCALFAAGGSPWMVLLAGLAGAALGEGVRSWLQLTPSAPAGSPAPAPSWTSLSAEPSQAQAVAEEPGLAPTPHPDPSVAQSLLPHTWPSETRWGRPWGEPRGLAVPLRKQLEKFGIESLPVSPRDAAAAAIAVDAWMFATGASTIRSAAQYGPAHLAALSAAIVRAGGLASAEVVAPFEAPASSPALALALRGWVAWACAELATEDAALALRLAATDLSSGSGFGDELSQLASTIFAAAEELERITAAAQ